MRSLSLLNEKEFKDKVIYQMKIFSSLINRLSSVSTRPITMLGRWHIDYSHNALYRKIDLANEDNCGPCGDYKNKEDTIKERSPLKDEKRVL